MNRVVAAIEGRYPPATAEAWDRVGLVVGDPTQPVRRVLLAVDCVHATVAEAVRVGAQLLVTHHPLLLRGVHSVAANTLKGGLVHELIRAGIGLYTAHTNADVASPGVGDALAARLELRDVRPMRADVPHPGRVGRLGRPCSLAELAVAAERLLPGTAVGVRAAGDPGRRVETLGVVGGPRQRASTPISPLTCATTLPASTWMVEGRRCSMLHIGQRNGRGSICSPCSCAPTPASRSSSPTW